MRAMGTIETQTLLVIVLHQDYLLYNGSNGSTIGQLNHHPLLVDSYESQECSATKFGSRVVTSHPSLVKMLPTNRIRP